MKWLDLAVCRDEDPELFFPVGTSGPALQQIADAKSVCRRCPVVAECRSWAMNAGLDYGVFGGLDEAERRSLKESARPVPRVSKQGKKTELRGDQVSEVLDLLDAGHRLPSVQRRTGIGREVCRRLWREHRGTKNPPGHNYTRRQLEERGIRR